MGARLEPVVRVADALGNMTLAGAQRGAEPRVRGECGPRGPDEAGLGAGLFGVEEHARVKFVQLRGLAGEFVAWRRGRGRGHSVAAVLCFGAAALGIEALGALLGVVGALFFLALGVLRGGAVRGWHGDAKRGGVAGVGACGAGAQARAGKLWGPAELGLRPRDGLWVGKRAQETRGPEMAHVARGGVFSVLFRCVVFLQFQHVYFLSKRSYTLPTVL